MNDDYHFIQRKILHDLLFGNELKYSELKPENMEGSQFTFHLNKLVDAGVVIKTDEHYTLTANGKNIANSFDSDSINPRKQAKHSVVFCAFRKSIDKNETLLYTRMKNPFYKHQGYPTGKVMYGESILETARREFYEETGLLGNAKLIGIRHFRVYHPTPNDLVEDKVMYVCRIDEPTGNLSSNEEGEFFWVDLDKIDNKISNPLPEFKEIFEALSNFKGEITFAEIKQYPKKF